jgi:histone-lysine N-methyltransferase MLL2
MTLLPTCVAVVLTDQMLTVEPTTAWVPPTTIPVTVLAPVPPLDEDDPPEDDELLEDEEPPEEDELLDEEPPEEEPLLPDEEPPEDELLDEEPPEEEPLLLLDDEPPEDELLDEDPPEDDPLLLEVPPEEDPADDEELPTGAVLPPPPPPPPQAANVTAAMRVSGFKNRLILFSDTSSSRGHLTDLLSSRHAVLCQCRSLKDSETATNFTSSVSGWSTSSQVAGRYVNWSGSAGDLAVRRIPEIFPWLTQDHHSVPDLRIDQQPQPIAMVDPAARVFAQ